MKYFIHILIIPFVACAYVAFSEVPDVFEQRITFAEMGWGEMGLGTAAHAKDKPGRPLQIGDKHYEKGLGVHAPGRIVADLGGEYRLFTAQTGVQAHPDHDQGSVIFRVIADGVERFNSGLMKQNDPALSIRVDVTGVDELELVVEDGGDGREFDLANWANPSLLPVESKAPRAQEPSFDIASFARVMSWPPEQRKSQPGRVEELSTDQIFLGTPLVPNVDGLYTAPFTSGEPSCIGLQWHENRYPAEATLCPHADLDPAVVSGARLEWWAGESEWQGEWQDLNAEVTSAGNDWLFRIPRSALYKAKIGVQKLRWVFPPSPSPIRIHTMKVSSTSRQVTSRIRIALERSDLSSNAVLELYNAVFLEPAPEGNGSSLCVDLSGELRFTLKHLKPRPGQAKSDRGILRLELPRGRTAVAIDDVLEQGCVYMPDYGLFIAREPDGPTLEQHKETLKERESILDAVRSRPDQCFEQALKNVHREIQNNGPTMLSLACDNHKFTVYENGGVEHRIDLPIAPGKDRREAIAAPEYPLLMDMRLNGASLKKNLRQIEEGWMPIQNTAYAADNGTVLRQRVFVAPFGLERPLESTGWLQPKALFVAELVLENPAELPAETELELHFFLDMKRQTFPEIVPLPQGAAVMRNNTLLACFEAPKSEGETITMETGRLSIGITLEPQSRRFYQLFLPAWDASVEQCASFADATGLDEATKAYWNTILKPALQVDIPEALLQDIICAGQVHCLMTARNEAQALRVAPWCGADRYGPLESESQAIIHGMSLMGHREFARRSLDYFIERYNRDGLLTTGYTLMGVGWHLWTLADHYALYRDKAWLEETAPRIEKACRWIVSECEKTKRMNPDGTKPFEYGLVSPGVSADWNRFAYQARPQGEYYAGLAGISRAFADIGYPGAEDLAKTAADFRESIVRAYTWTQERSPAVQRRDGAWIPYCPAHFGCFGRVMDLYPNEDGGRSWGKDMSMGAHNLVTLGVLDPTGQQQETAWIAEYLEDFWCLQAGMGAYTLEETAADWFNLGGFSKVQPYYTRLVELHALRDDIKPFLRAYLNAIPSLLNRENLNTWEHFGNGGAWDKPHETGWFLAQTRLMLVMERGTELWLAPFVSQHWMDDGEHVSVRNVPTRFGEIAYTLSSHVDSGYIEADVELPDPCSASSVVVRLRHPREARMLSVSVNQQPHTLFNAERECVFLPEARGKLHIRVNYPVE